MASFLTDLAKTYVEKLINDVIAESSYICCFTCIAKDFEEEKARLEIERTTFKQRIEVATQRGEDVQGNALSWVEDADKLIQEDTKTKQKRFFKFCPRLIWTYKRGKVLANKKEHIKELMKRGKELTIRLPARLPERYSSQHYVHFQSRESKYIELLDELKDDNNYIIGLQGMGGIGKTTLIKEVGKKLKQFTHIIDTTVSSSPDIKKIQDDIAGPLGLTLDDCNESDRPKKLWSRLANGEKILLILDDVWGDIDFNEIGIPYSDNHQGCRIVVTTRSLSVCEKLGCIKTIQLDLLSEEDAWIMFKRYAGLSEMSTNFFIDKGRKIANECKRLPIAIAVIASNLKGEHRRDEWDVALKSLQKPMSMYGDDDLLKIYKCLKFSYDNMKNEKAKNLFLLCSVFREDEEVHTECLARLAIGGGLFGEDYGSYQDARSQVVISKNKLLDSCLLLESGQHVKMHDLVRDAAQWIANKEIQTIQVNEKNQKAMVEIKKHIKYLSCEGKAKDVFSCKLDGSKLEILIVNIYWKEDVQEPIFEVPNSFFENNIGLRVFYLRVDYCRAALSLPQSIQSLKNIRSLIFRCGDYGDISILGNLQSLETLDLINCKINELPCGIAMLEKFILLRLQWCVIDENNPFGVIEKCSSLQELHFCESFNEYCLEITFPKLQMFYLGDHNSNDFSSSKCVYLEHENAVFLSETTLKFCMQEAEVLRLGRIEGGWRNIIPEIVPLYHGMNDLVDLRLRCVSQLNCLVDTKHTYSQVSPVFSKLVKLHLNEMENLEELCNGPLSYDSFKSLEELSIENCKHLQSLFKCNLNLCNLKNLSLEGCPKLEIILPLVSAGDLPALESITMKSCDKLKYIFCKDVKLGFLKNIKLEDVPNFIDIFPATSLSAKKSSSNLMESNTYCLNINIWERAKCISRQSKILCNIKEIELTELRKIKSIFVLSIAPRMLLETLRIKDCDELKHIIIDTEDHDNGDGNNLGNMFPKLKVLSIEDCIQLEYIFGHYTHDHQNHTEVHLHLPTLECLQLSNLQNLAAICPKQYHITFPHLKELELNNCLQLIGDSMPHHFVDATITKKLSGNMESLLALERLVLEKYKVKSIFCVNEVNQLQMNSLLQKIWLKDLYVTTCLFVGPRNSFVFGILTQIKIMRCEKLQVIFSNSILRCLPQLIDLIIKECDELKHIIEDDFENKKMSNSSFPGTCFPKLKVLVVEKCNKLKCLFPFSICNEFPELKYLLA